MLGILWALVGLISSGIPVAGMSDQDLRFHQAQLTYCKLQEGKRVYRQERLDDFCVIKVMLFDDQVSN